LDVNFHNSARHDEYVTTIQPAAIMVAKHPLEDKKL
jgi:hypothetical protein